MENADAMKKLLHIYDQAVIARQSRPIFINSHNDLPESERWAATLADFRRGATIAKKKAEELTIGRNLFPPGLLDVSIELAKKIAYAVDKGDSSLITIPKGFETHPADYQEVAIYLAGRFVDELQTMASISGKNLFNAAKLFDTATEVDRQR